MFWHTLWKTNERPTVGLIADIRRSTRTKYHFSVKQARKLQDSTKANKLAANLMNSDYVEFWKKVKLINKDIKKLPISINNVSGEEKISEISKEKNCDLLNSVSYKESEMLEHQALLDRNVCKICTSENCYSDHKINIYDVKKAITFLKKGKRDGNCEMDSEHLIYGSNQLYVHISMLFQSMFFHLMVFWSL